MRTCIFVNARAGSAPAAADLREQLIGRPDVSWREPTSADELRDAVAEALAAGCDTLVAAGGDGTVHALVNALAPHFDRARVGVLPLGTGNDLCRTLAIPFDPLEALTTLAQGRERRLDLIRVETPTRRLYCLNAATGGFTGQMQEVMTDDVKAWWGPLAYLRGAAEVLPNLTGYRTCLRLDDGPPQYVEVLNVLVANGRTAGGGLRVAPGANPEDGLLDVVTVRYGPLLDLTAVGARLLAGNYLDSDSVRHQTARRVEVVATPGMWFSIDGEPLTQEAITFSVLPRALRILVGADYRPVPDETP
jgi:diacylglycerol kinase (ATP)